MHRSLVLALALVFSAACGGAAPQPAPSADLAPAAPTRPSPQRPRPEVPHFDAPDGGGDGG